jgi:hypothetical protein
MEDQFRELIELQRQTFVLVQDVQQLHDDFRAEVEQSHGERLDLIIARFTPLLDERLKAQAALLRRVRLLTDEIARQGGPGPAIPVGATDIARQFRAVVDQLQTDAAQPRAGATATTIKSMDVEIKALIVVEENEPRFVTPTPGRTFDPAQLSTIRMSFGSIPLLRPTPAEGGEQ